MKRILSFLLLSALLVALCTPAMATESSYTILLKADDTSIPLRKEITVSLVLVKDGSADIDFYSFQDYICFDPDAFQYVDGSLQVSALDSQGNPLLRASPLPFYDSGTGPINRIFVNRASSMPATISSGSVLLTFRLKALKTGGTTLTHDTVELFQTWNAPFSVSEGPAQITITSAKHSDSGMGGGGGSGGGPVGTPSPPPDPLPEEESLPFMDVKETDWFYSAVRFVYEKDLFTGTSAKHFEPNLSMNRAMLVTVLHRMEQEPKAKSPAFSDVDRASWFASAVGWAAEEGVADGYPDGRFCPEAPMTREQLAALLYRYAALKQMTSTATGNLSQFADRRQVSPWATEAMKWAVGKNLISGKGNGILDPQGTATRAEVATILMRFFHLFSEAAGIE